MGSFCDQNFRINFISEKLAIAWIDLKFFEPKSYGKKSKQILCGVSGFIDFGTLTALMGPSGAGKTTLLKCINGYQMNDIESCSQIYLSRQTKIRSSFIVQDTSEHLLYGLTALQALIYASKLKNRGIVCDHKENALKLLSQLMISDIDRTRIESCSGGEQRVEVSAEHTLVAFGPSLD